MCTARRQCRCASRHGVGDVVAVEVIGERELRVVANTESHDMANTPTTGTWSKRQSRNMRYY
jgi:hypothetical protein